MLRDPVHDPHHPDIGIGLREVRVAGEDLVVGHYDDNGLPGTLKTGQEIIHKSALFQPRLYLVQGVGSFQVAELAPVMARSTVTLG